MDAARRILIAGLKESASVMNSSTIQDAPVVPSSPQRLPSRAATRVLEFETGSKSQFFNLTGAVEQLVAESGIHNGFVLVQSLHATAALFVNEWQDALLEDFRTLVQKIVPGDVAWKHNDPRYSDCDRANAASHLGAALLGSSVVLGVQNGRLVRGTWQSVILAELDGPRKRSVHVQVFGG